MNKRRFFLHLFVSYFHVGIIVFLYGFICCLFKRVPFYYAFISALRIYESVFNGFTGYLHSILTQALLLYYIFLSLFACWLWWKKQTFFRGLFLYFVNIVMQIPSFIFLSFYFYCYREEYFYWFRVDL